AVTALGLQIPEEVAVIGADNDRLVCEVTNPPLTSIVFSHEQAGYQAAEMLDKLMKGQKVAEKSVITSPVNVIERQSTDTLKIGDIDIAKAHQFIKSYANKGIQVGDVAKEAAMSIRALQIRFKKVFKRTVHQEIRIHQVEFVAKLLTETNMPMNKIAEMSGFATSEYMSQVFRKIKGMSMSQYRKDYNHW
ncbi:MAG: helix-turn-helix transcriptional regulator, partial [Planctomycetota bacterium]